MASFGMLVAIYEKNHQKSGELSLSVERELNAKGIECKRLSGFDDSINTKFDKILAFGGDGTMLRAAAFSARIGAPVLGVNVGNVGFLAETDLNDSPKHIADLLINGKPVKRSMLSLTLNGKQYSALNEIVLKSLGTRPVYLTLSINGEYVDKYHGDGIIVATATGSTAYSLSAGGPVLAPEVDAIIVNPVCAHTLHSRPLVVGGNSVINLSDNDTSINVIVDGNLVDTANASSTVRVTKADFAAEFVKCEGNNFYKKLLDKMNRWGISPIGEQ